MPNGLLGGYDAPALLQAHRNQQEAPHKRNVLDRILGLYGADPGTHIPDPARRQEALGRGLMGAGQAIGAISGRGWDSPTVGQIISTGLGAMQQTGPTIAREQRQQQVQKMLEGGAMTVPQLQAAIQTLIASGDPANMEQAKILRDVLDRKLWAEEQGQMTQASQKAFQKTRAYNPETQRMELATFNPNTGEFAFSGIEAPDSSRLQLGTAFNPETGVEEVTVFNPATGAFQFTNIPKKDATAQEKSMATDAALMERAVGDVESALETMGRGPTFAEWQMYKHDLTRPLVPDEVQGLLQAEEALISHLARIVTGSVRAAASEPIRQAIFRSYLVAPGDSPLNREQTLRNLRMIADRLKTEAGRAWVAQNAGITPEMIAEAGGEVPEQLLENEREAHWVDPDGTDWDKEFEEVMNQ